MPVPVIVITAGITTIGAIAKAGIDYAETSRKCRKDERLALLGVIGTGLTVVGVSIKLYGEYKARELGGRDGGASVRRPSTLHPQGDK